MTEQEWLKERVQNQRMVWALRGTAATRTKRGRRRLRLFGCGCCRHIWSFIWDDRLRKAVEIAESFAEGRATKAELLECRESALAVPTSGYLTPGSPGVCESTIASLVCGLTYPEALSAAFGMTCFIVPLAGCLGSSEFETALICDTLRDVFGNPFRPVTFSKSWRTSTAVALASQMYEGRDFGAMPILADALQDAGCDSDDVLNHCRDPHGVHVRGCWVVDLVLGKV